MFIFNPQKRKENYLLIWLFINSTGLEYPSCNFQQIVAVIVWLLFFCPPNDLWRRKETLISIEVFVYSDNYMKCFDGDFIFNGM